jgi:hypothetical protein
MRKLVILSLLLTSCATWKQDTQKTVDYINAITRNMEPAIQTQINIQAVETAKVCTPIWEVNCLSICEEKQAQSSNEPSDNCIACILTNCPKLKQLQDLRLKVAETFKKIFTLMKYINLGMPYLEKEKLLELKSQLTEQFNLLNQLLKQNNLGDGIVGGVN